MELSICRLKFREMEKIQGECIGQNIKLLRILENKLRFEIGQ
jgi:hypothetical protein